MKGAAFKPLIRNLEAPWPIVPTPERWKVGCGWPHRPHMFDEACPHCLKLFETAMRESPEFQAAWKKP